MKNYTFVISAVSIALLALLAPMPILAAEVPKVQAIKNDNSLSKMQKMQQLRAIHQQSDPQMKAILSPDQYKKLQQIRLQTIREATQGRF